jgi:hypothetical protein
MPSIHPHHPQQAPATPPNRVPPAAPRAHSTPEPDQPKPQPDKAPPPDDMPLPEQAPIEEPQPPKPPIKT